MKKSKTKLSFRKSTIVALENIRGGRVAYTSDSCPGAQCPSEKHSCNKSCNGYPKCDVFN